MNPPVQAANGSLGAAGQPRRIFDSDSAREGASLARGMSAHAAALRAAAAAGPAALPAGAATGSQPGTGTSGRDSGGPATVTNVAGRGHQPEWVE
jgi:hypothetical protein